MLGTQLNNITLHAAPQPKTVPKRSGPENKTTLLKTCSSPSVNRRTKSVSRSVSPCPSHCHDRSRTRMRSTSISIKNSPGFHRFKDSQNCRSPTRFNNISRLNEAKDKSPIKVKSSAPTRSPIRFQVGPLL